MNWQRKIVSMYQLCALKILSSGDENFLHTITRLVVFCIHYAVLNEIVYKRLILIFTEAPCIWLFWHFEILILLEKCIGKTVLEKLCYWENWYSIENICVLSFTIILNFLLF